MVGKTILHYKIVEKLGEGGMGVVYLAQDTRLDRQVAIKFLPHHIVDNSEERQRFQIEAKAAAALNHLNITQIYAIEESDEQLFLVMEYVEGKELKEIISNPPSSPLSKGEQEGGCMSIELAISIATQIAEGLQAAHEKDIVHRDIKSSNIMITDKGQVKIMDFGLAKVGMGVQLTREHSTLGTLSYMSPEQIRGENVEQRSDIWSFGVVLYEMLTGELPFKGDYEQAVSYAILNENPEQPEKNIPGELQEIILKALEKDLVNRFQSVAQILEKLGKIRSDRLSEANNPPFKKKAWILAGTGVAIIVVFLFVLVPYYRLVKKQHAKEILPQIENSIQERNYDEAFHLAKSVENDLNGDPGFQKLIPGYADSLTVISKPTDVRIYLKEFSPKRKQDNSEMEFLGLTPIYKKQIIRGGHKIFLEKEGYAPAERVFSSALAMEGSQRSTNITIEVELYEKTRMIENMVFIPGGAYSLVGWDAPTSRELKLNDFYMDKYEVSNKDYKEFIDAGGYFKKQYWNHPIIHNGQIFSWEDAISQFTDRTGLPGPRHWLNQKYPEGLENHPVTNINWYEAAAYAEFSGKRLPTVFQWEKAARNGEYHIYDLVMPWGLRNPNESILQRANFESNGTEAVDSYEFGISPFGCYNMAGNVKEWCLNETKDGFITTGGSWQDPLYMFANFGAFPSFYTSHNLGFRCVRLTDDVSIQEDTMKIDLEERIPVYKPVDERTYKSFFAHYRYDKKPLNPRIIDSTETVDWTKEKIIFSGDNNDQIIAYLYIPKKAAEPFQCINWIPHSGVIDGYQRTDEAAEYGLGSHIKAGRALLALVPKGALERPRDPGFEWPDISTVKYRDMVIDYVTEFSLGLDYLATRDDIDMDRLAFLGTSWGATRTGVIIAALEKRYHSVIFMAGGVRKRNLNALSEINMINFAPHIKAPKLLLNGKYDEVFALETEAKPFYKLLREPKKMVLVESGHVPPIEQRVPIINRWLDETLGPVKFKK
jgi:serine/threonine protein kinase